MASPSATTVLHMPTSSSFRFQPPYMAVLLFLTALRLAAALRPTSSSSSGGASPEPILTFCSWRQSSSPAITSGELASFLDAVCAGAYSGVAHMSHNMSSYVAGANRTVHGVAQCRPDVPVPDCAACLAAASTRLVAGRTEACPELAVWHDACFLRYSDRDTGSFREDEYTATVFNTSRRALSDGKALVRRLLTAAGNTTTSSHMCRGVGAGTASVAGGLVHGVTRCAAGISCDDCRRCLWGALAVAERKYNGSSGMQVLRLSCMAR